MLLFRVQASGSRVVWPLYFKCCQKVSDTSVGSLQEMGPNSMTCLSLCIETDVCYIRKGRGLKRAAFQKCVGLSLFNLCDKLLGGERLNLNSTGSPPT